MLFFSTLRCFRHFVFFFNYTATTEIYTLSLHDALPISWERMALTKARFVAGNRVLGAIIERLISEFVYERPFGKEQVDRKSTRLNSSHLGISYAVFCLKKKKNNKQKTKL